MFTNKKPPIGYTFIFDDYTNLELIEIFKGMVKKSGFILDDKAIDKLNEIIDQDDSLCDDDNENEEMIINTKTVKYPSFEQVLKADLDQLVKSKVNPLYLPLIFN